jgi:hypothetical protein
MEFHTLQSVPLARSRRATRGFDSRRPAAAPRPPETASVRGGSRTRRDAQHYLFTPVGPGPSGRFDFRALLPGSSPLRERRCCHLSERPDALLGFGPRRMGVPPRLVAPAPKHRHRSRRSRPTIQRCRSTPGAGRSPRTRPSTNRSRPSRAAEAPQLGCQVPREHPFASRSAPERAAGAARQDCPASRKQSPTSRSSPRSAAGAPLVARLTPRRPSPRSAERARPRGRSRTDEPAEARGGGLPKQGWPRLRADATDPPEVSLPRRWPSLFGSDPVLAHGFASGSNHVAAAALPLFGR